jgi:hypothetical protein
VRDPRVPQFRRKPSAAEPIITARLTRYSAEIDCIKSVGSSTMMAYQPPQLANART